METGPLTDWEAPLTTDSFSSFLTDNQWEKLAAANTIDVLQGYVDAILKREFIHPVHLRELRWIAEEHNSSEAGKGEPVDTEDVRALISPDTIFFGSSRSQEAIYRRQEIGVHSARVGRIAEQLMSEQITGFALRQEVRADVEEELYSEDFYTAAIGVNGLNVMRDSEAGGYIITPRKSLELFVVTSRSREPTHYRNASYTGQAGEMPDLTGVDADTTVSEYNLPVISSDALEDLRQVSDMTLALFPDAFNFIQALEEADERRLQEQG